MSDLGLLHFRSATDLRKDDAERTLRDEETRRQELFESSLSAHIRRAWEDARRAKVEVEERLLDCLRRRSGKYSAEKLRLIEQEGGSAIFMMLTATKCRAASSWLRDILMPANERPWGLDPTPVSEIPQEYLMPVMQQIQQQMMAAQEQGQQIDMTAVRDQARKQIRSMAQEKAEEAAELHEDLIADQLAEGKFDDALEAFIDDFVTFPTAFVHAPIARRVPALQWLEGWQPIKTTEVRLESERISPFDVYPSSDSTTTDDGTALIIRKRYTRTYLNQVKTLKSYNTEAVDEVLREYGQGGLREWLWEDSERRRLEGRENEMLSSSQTIDGLLYFGAAQGLTLLQWGMDPDEVPDPLAEYEIEAILIGRHVIKVKINRDPLERRPIHSASFQPVPGSFWGISIPELMMDIQDICNATARSLVNNLAISSGPQVEVYEDRLQPQEDPTDIYPWKIWRTKDSAMGANNRAVNFFQPQSNAQELMAVYESFEIKADDATNIPRYTYGNEKVGGAGDTASGLSMLMESANKGIKDAVRHIDRGVIRRVIEGHWLHNMQYSNDDSIKGDASVVPRGSSAMLIREQTHALRGQFLASTANEYDMAIIGQEGRRKLLEKISDKLDMPGLIPSKEDLENQQASSQELNKIMRQLELAEREAKVQESQGKAMKSQADVQTAQVDAQKTMAETGKTQVETQRIGSLTPLEAQHLLAQIGKLLMEIKRERREAVEGPGSTVSQPGGQHHPRVAAAGPANGAGEPRGLQRRA